MSDPHNTVVHITPGAHQLVVFVEFNTGLGGSGIFQSVINLSCQLEAGRTYRLNGTVRGAEYVAWIEEATTNSRTGPEATAPYMPQAKRGYTPIFIPK